MEKKSGDNRIHRIWRINIYKADYNLLLKFFWPKQANYQEEIDFLVSNEKRNNFILFNVSRNIDLALVNFTALVSLFLLEPNLLASIASLVGVGFFE